VAKPVHQTTGAKKPRQKRTIPATAADASGRIGATLDGENTTDPTYGDEVPEVYFVSHGDGNGAKSSTYGIDEVTTITTGTGPHGWCAAALHNDMIDLYACEDDYYLFEAAELEAEEQEIYDGIDSSECHFAFM
jgi:hypothetical protein